MIYGKVKQQHLALVNTHAAADTIGYLEMQFDFTPDWTGVEKWAHFASGDTVYDIPLTDDRIRKEDHLDLVQGEWTVYLHGNRFADEKVIERITTDVARLYVSPTGMLDGEPFPEIPASETERILARLTELEENGGASAPGIDGKNGTTFTPSVDEAGNLSWTNDGGLENPAMVNIKGAKGDKGDPGEDGAPGVKGDKGEDGEPGTPGQSAFLAAQAGGYTGTEAEFYTDLAAIDGLAAWFAAY